MFSLNEIVAVSVYKEISGLTGDRDDKKREIFDPDCVKTPEKKPESISGDPIQEKVSFTCEPIEAEELDKSTSEDHVILLTMKYLLY